MGSFSRTYRNLARLFPPSGSEYPDPRFATQTIQLIEALHDRLFVVNGRLVNESNTSVLAVGNNDTDYSEPPAGEIWFPLLISAGNPDAVTRTFRIFVEPTTTTPLDPWGRVADVEQVLFDYTIPTGRTLPFHTSMPVTRGNFIRVRRLAMTGGNNRSDFMFAVSIPGELASLQQFLALRGTSLSPA